MLVQCSVRPKGLDPFLSAKAWHLRKVQGLPWKEVQEQVRTASGERPQRAALVLLTPMDLVSRTLQPN